MLISPFTTPVNAESLDVVISQLKTMCIDLIVISNDLEYELADDGDSKITFSQSQTKPKGQIKSEQLIEKVLDETNGVLCNFNDAIVHLSFFPGTKSKSQPWHCPLEIGAGLKINITAYISITREKFQTWKTESTTMNTTTKCSYEYTRNGIMVKEEELEDTIKGYMYGSKMVPYDSTLKWDYETGAKSLICVGFTEEQYLLDEYFLGTNTNVVVPSVTCATSQKMLSTLVAVMMDMGVVMIARRVRQAKASPKMMALIPQIHPTLNSPFFTMIELIFSENKLDFHFPNLHTNKSALSGDQIEAVDQLIDAMDLMAATQDDPPQEAFSAQKTLNPSVQFTYRAIAHRAMHPNEPLPKFSEDLAEMFEIPKPIQNKLDQPITKIRALFPLEVKVEDKKEKWLKKQRADPSTTTTDFMDVSTISSDSNNNRNISEIGTVSPMEDFDLLFRRGEKFSVLCGQMQAVLSDLVFKSTFGSSFQDEKISKALLFYREQAKIVGAHYYNDWMETFKSALLNRNKTEFWESVIVKENLGLIESNESETSSITAEEAQDFLKANSGKKVLPSAAPEVEDDDLFDEM